MSSYFVLGDKVVFLYLLGSWGYHCCRCRGCEPNGDIVEMRVENGVVFGENGVVVGGKELGEMRRDLGVCKYFPSVT